MRILQGMMLGAEVLETMVLLVQCDFDDTISVGNVSVALREAFAPDEWRRMEQEYISGKYTVEESNIRQYALIRTTEKELHDFVKAEAVVRDGFQDFAEYCQAQGIRLVVVSSGLDIYIKPTLDQSGLDYLEVHSARAYVTPSGIRVEYADPRGTVITGGFKESFLREFKSQGHTMIYVGDGLSDITPAREAGFVIARSTLERYLKENGLPYYGFDTFADVRRHVEEIRLSGGG